SDGGPDRHRGLQHGEREPEQLGSGPGRSLAAGPVPADAVHEGHWVPTTSVAVQETFPTGRYDRLGDRPSAGLGSGAYVTTLALSSQTYFWPPNGRILRMRLNVSQSFPGTVSVDDASVYGTVAGFRGQATPGRSLFLDAAWEYSLTRRWVLALD